MLIGYARISTTEQNFDLQIDALEAIGCTRIFCDKLSGAKTDRPQLKKALEACGPGDTLVVWKLDRLGRSLQHLIETVAGLGRREVGFRTCCDGIDTTTSSGKLVFHIFAALAEFERTLIRERTLAGLEAARKRGIVGGRPKKITIDKLNAIRRLIDSGTSKRDVALLFDVSPATLWRALKCDEANPEEHLVS